MIKSIEWTGDSLKIIDQTEIPSRLIYKELKNIQEVFEAIRKLQVRGAPALGVAAVFGLYLGLKDEKHRNQEQVIRRSKELASYLAQARPTAVNLQWALQSVISQVSRSEKSVEETIQAFLQEALAIQEDDRDRCRRIGEHGASLVKDGMTVLTHCNTGALATAGIGTAFGILYTAHQQGKKIEVYVDETRPLLQGARLTMWELKQAAISAVLISDNMAAYAMRKKNVDMVVVGADRIASNGDVANKIGTYSLAIAARYHDIPFYVAAPLSTFDLSLPTGDSIPIEERDGEEVSRIWEKLSITVPGATCWNPAFDVTPAELIHGIVTEEGIFTPPFEKIIQHLTHHNYQNQEEYHL
jgi:methylthioribose-1-phosphate isomerase